MTRDAERSSLHPLFREKIEAVLAGIAKEGLAFKLFEGFRSPARQNALFGKGRSSPGDVVTYARAWESLHQYGLAADFVLFLDGKWSWDDKGEAASWWKRLGEIAQGAGLERLSFETPHLQLPGANLRELRAGVYPTGGDASWAENLERAILSWSGEPGAPPPPMLSSERPPLSFFSVETAPAGGIPGPHPGESGWHSLFGGRSWRHDENGVYVREHEDGEMPLRTKGEPVTMRAVLDRCADSIFQAAVRRGVPAALIMMTIATETAFARADGFTGPRTFRWEPHVEVRDATPPHRGDYSAGPMQTLATTAREIIRKMGLAYDPFAVAPDYPENPIGPTQHPLYEYGNNIDIGAAEIAFRIEKTGFDPILTAAAYNAGSLRESGSNPWRLHSHGDHLDRAARWYGDACAVLKER